MRTIWILLFAGLGLAACKNPDKMIMKDDLAYGEPIEAEWDEVNDRARFVLSRKYPKGLDPDKSNELDGDYVTLWRYDKSVFYRKTMRHKARVKVEDLGDGKCRVGVSVVEEISDNIDNPDSIDVAKWQSTRRSPDKELLIEQSIARRWSNFEVSDKYKEQHRENPRTTMRPDLVEKYRDVDLEAYKEGGESNTFGDTTPITGDSEEKKKKFEELD